MVFWDEDCCQSANHQSKRCKDLGDPLRSPFRFLVRVTLVEFLVDAVIDLFDNPRIIWLKTMAHIHCRFFGCSNWSGISPVADMSANNFCMKLTCSGQTQFAIC